MVFSIRRLCRGKEAVTKPIPFFKRNTIELPKGYRKPRKRKQKAAEPVQAEQPIVVKPKPRLRYRRNGRMMPFRRRNEPIPRGMNWCEINGQKLRQDVFFGEVIGRKWIPGQLAYFDHSNLPMGDGCVITNQFGDGGGAGQGANDGSATVLATAVCARVVPAAPVTALAAVRAVDPVSPAPVAPARAASAAAPVRAAALASPAAAASAAPALIPAPARAVSAAPAPAPARAVSAAAAVATAASVRAVLVVPVMVLVRRQVGGSWV